MARVICIKPCKVSVSMPAVVQRGMSIPGLGSTMKPSMSMDFRGNCDTCEAAVSFVAQFQPFLNSLGMPLCLLKCANKLISVVTSFRDVLTGLPAPDISKPIQKIIEAGLSCAKCFTAWTPLAFVQFVIDIMDVILTVLACVESVLTKIATVRLRAAVLMADPVPAIAANGYCINEMITSEQEALLVKLGTITSLLDGMQFLFDFIGTAIPVPIPAMAFDVSSMTGASPPADILKVLHTLVTTLRDVRSILSPLA